jgi:hypothetical protein
MAGRRAPLAGFRRNVNHMDVSTICQHCNKNENYSQLFYVFSRRVAVRSLRSHIRLRLRGLSDAHDKFLLAAVAQNLGGGPSSAGASIFMGVPPSHDRWTEAIPPHCGSDLNYFAHTHAALMLPADFLTKLTHSNRSYSHLERRL